MVLSVLLVFVLHITVGLVEAQQPCCTPLQWQATLGVTYGQAIIIDSNTTQEVMNLNAEFAFDWNNSTAAMWMTGTQYSPLVPKPQPVHTAYIWDHATVSECVNDAVHVATAHLGPSQVVCDIFRFKYSAAAVTVARKGCIPVRVSLLEGTPTTGGFFFDAQVYNMKEGIHNTSLLSPPSYCTHGNNKHSLFILPSVVPKVGTPNRCGRTDMAILSVLLMFVLHITVGLVEAQQPCCTPLQWQATLGVTYGQAFIDSNTAQAVINVTAEFAFDWNKRTTAMWMTGTQYSPLVPKPQPVHTAYIWDHATGVMWTIDLTRQSCQHSELSKGPVSKLCVADDAVHVATAQLGPSQMVCDIFKFKWPVGEGTAAAVATVARKGCTPVRMSILDGSPTSGGIFFDARVYNMKEGIHNTSLLSPPEYCAHSNNVTAHEPLPPLGKLFSSL
ncbi:Hypp395 [Branchiostoma lanceolatum]|uniref:Hypp395 protein n=1 Tax=Branchiostoma lanceolatum TaxID=7740 RepID=A0A8J9VZT3_BRALA|nr:Hypp395 [Branchiostoma lanceolatum]